MYFSKSKQDVQIEQRLEQQSNKIKELEIQGENLDREVGNFLSGLNVTPEQLTAFIESKDNFTEKNWSELVQYKKQIDDKLQRELDNIRNPIKAKRAYSNLYVEQHWLRVR